MPNSSQPDERGLQMNVAYNYDRLNMALKGKAVAAMLARFLPLISVISGRIAWQ
jgi:hypothetical protein